MIHVGNEIGLSTASEELLHYLQTFALEKMEWPENYTQEKIVPLMTLWDLRNIQQGAKFNQLIHLLPSRSV